MSIANEEETLKDRQSVEDRREMIYEMHLKGSTEKEIAESVGVNQSTVSRSLEIMGKRSRDWFRQHWEKGNLHGSLIKEQRDRLMGLVREAWNLYRRIDETDIGKEIQVLSLVKSTIKDLGETLGLTAAHTFGPYEFQSGRSTRRRDKETIEIDLSQGNARSRPLRSTTDTSRASDDIYS